MTGAGAVAAGERPPAILVMGPTATGKTDLAVELVRRLPAEIVSVDSAMVYRGMDIGTAKPGPDILAMAPHRLIDFLDPAEPYSAARFRDDALREMADITARGRIPVLAGGTMLYFRALTEGLAELPGADAAIRAELEARGRAEGWPALHRELADVDPAAAERIHPNDAQRIQRALEVHRQTGRPLTELQGDRPVEAFPYTGLRVALMPPDRAWLHERIERRFHAMMERGFLDEVRQLYERGDLTRRHPSVRAVGYRQLWAYLEGGTTRAEAVEHGIVATRQFAKRQLTWLRRDRHAHRLECTDPDLEGRVLRLAEERLARQ